MEEKKCVKSSKTNITKGYFKVALLIFIFAACYVFDLFLLSLITKGIFWKQFTSNSLTKSMSLVYIFLIYVSLIAVSFIFFKKTSGNFYFLKGKTGFLEGLVLGTVIFLFFVILNLIPGFFYKDFYNMADNSNIIVFLLKNLLACLAISFGEEFIFRGIILDTFEKHAGKIHGIIVMSIMFALAHMFGKGDFLYKSVYFINLFLLSIFLSTGNLIFKNIWFSVSAHFALIYLFFIRNSFGFMKISPEYSNIFAGLSNNPMAGLYASLILFSVTYLLYRGRYEREKIV